MITDGTLTQEDELQRLRQQVADLQAEKQQRLDADEQQRQRIAEAGEGLHARRAAEQQAKELEQQRIAALEPDVTLLHRLALTWEETLQIRCPVKSVAAKGVYQLALADVRGAIERLRRFEAR